MADESDCVLWDARRKLIIRTKSACDGLCLLPGSSVEPDGNFANVRVFLKTVNLSVLAPST